VLLFALVEILGVDESTLSLYDASLSEWAVESELPMTNLVEADA
jgi:3-mercaptopyruvate sulfurtransferase SseA